jgi:hypothetical protein
MPNQDPQFKTEIAERFKALPPVIQKAITSSDVEKNLRSMADRQKLHVDQWQALENEVMFALLGFKPVADLENNLVKSVGVTADIARALALDVNRVVFEPIRQELERELQHPQAQQATVSGTEAVETQALAQESAAAAPAPTPPSPKPDATAARAPASGAYKPGETSAQRKSVTDDPYREPPL